MDDGLAYALNAENSFRKLHGRSFSTFTLTIPRYFLDRKSYNLSLITILTVYTIIAHPKL